MKRLALAISVTLLLPGCKNDRAKTLAACKLAPLQSPRQLSYSETADYMRVCMEAAGYERRGSSQGCQDFLSDGACYEPTGWLAKLALKVETAFN